MGQPQHRQGRAPDPAFIPTEQLYQRYSDADLIEGSTVNPIRLRFPGQSTTRGKYSDPEDVLHPDCCGSKVLLGYGVLAIAVDDVADQTFVLKEQNRSRTFTLLVIHKPEDTCYAHSEIWCNDVGKNEVPETLPKTVKQAFRAAVARKLTIRIAADQVKKGAGEESYASKARITNKR